LPKVSFSAVLLPTPLSRKRRRTSVVPSSLAHSTNSLCSCELSSGLSISQRIVGYPPKCKHLSGYSACKRRISASRLIYVQIYRDHFGDKLRQARERAKLTQAQLAEKLGVEPSTVSKWENAKDFAGAEHLPTITKTLGTSSDYFEILNSELRAKGISEAAKLLVGLQATPQPLQRILVAILLQDSSHLKGSPPKVISALKTLFEALGIKPLT
jgi:transcriptional regulator with XRE-family HTH domain